MRQASNMMDNVHNLENVGMTRPQAEVLIKIVRSSVTEGNYIQLSPSESE